jgi:hypothetical protein
LELYAVFNRNVPQNKLQNCSSISNFMEHTGIDMSNRIFTSRKDSPTAPEFPFAKDVDPTGLLKRLGGDQLFHGEDNVVSYWERIAERGGGSK